MENRSNSSPASSTTLSSFGTRSSCTNVGSQLSIIVSGSGVDTSMGSSGVGSGVDPLS